MRLRKLIRIKGHKRATNKQVKEIIEASTPTTLKHFVEVTKARYGVLDK